MELFIRNLTIIFTTFYSFYKLLHISQLPKQKYLITTVLLILSSIGTSLLDLHYKSVSILFLIPLLCIFFTILDNFSIAITSIATLLAFSFSYVAFLISTIITALPFGFIHDGYNHILCQSISAIIQCILITSIFRFKRFRKGMPFLNKNTHSILGIWVSSMVILLAVLFNNNNYKHTFLIPYLCFYLIGLALLYFWKRNITKTYIDCLRENNITDLNQQIYNLNQRMAELEADNVRMAKIIHRDNKLIPAMEYAVTRYLSESGETTADKKRQGRSLLAELKEMSADRKNIITQSQSPELLLIKTDIEEIDRLLAFQCQQAADNHIQLQVMCSCNLKPLPQSGIEISDLKTVMADLIENAMIATKANHASSVLVSFSMLKNSYASTICDSGNPCTTEVLLNLGKKQITTHEDGSGIGLMNSFQLLDKYNASFIITEFEDSHTQYTKSVSIIFNGEHRYILKPKRSEEEIRMLQERKDLLIWI